MGGMRDGQRQDLPGNMKGFRLRNEKTIEERGIIIDGELRQGNLDEEGLTNVREVWVRESADDTVHRIEA